MHSSAPNLSQFFKPAVKNLPTKQQILHIMLMSSAYGLSVPLTVYMAPILNVQKDSICSEAGYDHLSLAILQAVLIGAIIQTIQESLTKDLFKMSTASMMFHLFTFIAPALVNSVVIQQIPIIQCLRDQDKQNCAFNRALA